MDSQDVLVEAANNLRLGNGNALEVGASRATTAGQRSNDELPKSVIVTNVGLSVFDDEQTKVRNFVIVDDVVKTENRRLRPITLTQPKVNLASIYTYGHLGTRIKDPVLCHSPCRNEA